jgi:hypothetical protein
MERLRGILPRIVDEAKRALDAELESLNRASLGEKLKLSRRPDPKILPPEGGWQIRILENTEDDVDQGDVVIYSELALPAKAELGAGSMTKRISTRRMSATTQTSYAAGSAPTVTASVRTANSGAAGAATPEAGAANAATPNDAFAVIEYEDSGGRKKYEMTKEQIVVGRGGRDYWTDLKLDSPPDVSREHFRLRRDPESGKFFLKDLSRLGTTINGAPAPSSIEFAEGERRDRNLEAPVPDHARIGLAGVVFLDFRSVTHG